MELIACCYTCGYMAQYQECRCTFIVASMRDLGSEDVESSHIQAVRLLSLNAFANVHGFGSCTISTTLFAPLHIFPILFP